MNRKPTLLCLDDDPMILKMYKRILENFTVITAQDSKQAARCAPNADVILSDWNLGKYTAKTFLELFCYKPTVILTGHPQMVELGDGVTVLQKPADQKEIQTALFEAIKNRGNHVEY